MLSLNLVAVLEASSEALGIEELPLKHPLKILLADLYEKGILALENPSRQGKLEGLNE